MDPCWPRSPAYTFWTSLNWLMFLVAVALLTWGTGEGWLPDIAIWAVAIVAAASAVAQFAAAYRLVSAQDEFVRGVAAKRVIAAAGVTITAAVFWGLAQQFLPVPGVPLWLVYPLFWGAFGMVT
ncbi:MAG TPA: hypothetical protein VGB54_01045, partial [Allosphingosinicella sp.]